MTYTPDLWVILEMTIDGEKPIHKILSSWLGGYVETSSWRISSGILKIEDHEEYYEITNYSGSVYICNKNKIGMSHYTTGIYTNWIEQLKENPGTSVKIISIGNILTISEKG